MVSILLVHLHLVHSNHYYFINVHYKYRQVKHFQNDYLGCNSVSWAPYNAIGSVPVLDTTTTTGTGTAGTVLRRLVTGSCDNTVRFWRCSATAEGSVWTEEPRQQTNGTVHSGIYTQIAFV